MHDTADCCADSYWLDFSGILHTHVLCWRDYLRVVWCLKPKIWLLVASSSIWFSYHDFCNYDRCCWFCLWRHIEWILWQHRWWTLLVLMMDFMEVIGFIPLGIYIVVPTSSLCFSACSAHMYIAVPVQWCCWFASWSFGILVVVTYSTSFGYYSVMRMSRDCFITCSFVWKIQASTIMFYEDILC